MTPESQVQYVNQHKNFEPHEENQLCGRPVCIQVTIQKYISASATFCPF